MKRFKNIILTKARTKVKITDLDGWLIELKYLVNGKESYCCQIIKPDLARRIERLQKEGFKRLQND